jgi:hypothetical protein
MMIAGCISLVLIFGGNTLLHLWLRRTDFHFSVYLWLAESVAITSAIWVTAFTDFLTIMDRIWIQVALVLVNGVSTVSLTLFLVPRMGLIGAVISLSFVGACFWTWLVPMIVRSTFATSAPKPAGYVTEM